MSRNITLLSRRGIFLAAAAASLALVSTWSFAQQAGPFTAVQAAAGERAYLENCAGCHGNTLAGANDSPALAGPGFMQSWGSRSTKALYQFISVSMPAGNPGSLSPTTYADILAFLLRANGAQAGTTALNGNTDVRVSAAANGQVPAEIQKGLAPPAQRAAAPAPASHHGLTVAGTIKSYAPVTDEMLTHPPDGDWLMYRRNYQGWSSAR